MATKGLGKGLGALIKSPGSSSNASLASAEPFDGEKVQEVTLDRIVPSPLQPRKRFNEEQLKELCDSIKEHGIIQPLIVRQVAGKLELIAGERRFRASERIQLPKVPVIVREADDGEVLEMALIENLQREDLDAIEEAEAFSRLAKEFGLKQEDIAKRVGKNRATVANSMRLLLLDKTVQSLISQKLITTGHAKAILGLKSNEEQKMVADMVVRKKLNVRATEKTVSDHLNGSQTKKKPTSGGGKISPQAEAYIRQIEDQLRSKFSTNIAVHHTDKKGKIEIEYYGNEDLGRILEVLGVSVD